MAYRRNPMPTTGALFITNPRRRSNGRQDLMVARELGYGGGYGGSQRAGKLKSRVGKSKKKAAADRRKYKAAYKRAGGDRKKAELKRTAPERRTRIKKGIRTWKRRYKVADRSSPKAREDFLALVIQPESKSKTRRSNPWSDFQAKHAGQGYSPQELSAMYRRKNPRRRRRSYGGLALKTNPRRRRRSVKRNGLALKRNGLALKTNRKTRRRNRRKLSAYNKHMSREMSGPKPKTFKQAVASWKRKNPSRTRRRKNPGHARKSSHRSLAMKRNTRRRRNGTKKGMTRRTARKAYMKKRRNPTRRRNTGFGALALKTNPSTGIKPLDMLTKAIASIPVVGKPIAPFAASLIVGGGAGYGIYFLQEKAEDHLPPALQPYAIPLLGVVSAVIVAKQPFGKKSTKEMAAAALVLGSGAVAAFNFAQERRAAKGAVEADADLAMVDTSGDMGALAMMQNPYTHHPAYGAWEYTGGALNNPYTHHPAYGAYEYTGEGALNNPGHSSEYSDAHYGDAHYSGDDFDSHEGHALMGGRRKWYQIFGRPGRRMYNRGQGGHASQHAGRHGHRWGWLIKLVGFEGARKLAAMPPAQRMAAIKQLKAFAQAKLKELMNPSLALNSMPDAPTGPYEEAGAHGAGGYGAFMYQGGDL